MKKRVLLTAIMLALGSLVTATANAHWFRHWQAPGHDNGGVIYTMTNSPDGNEVLLFARNRKGKLHPIPWATRSTGGDGAGQNAPGDPLGSQGSLVYDSGMDMLFAVNAGDNTVTAFDTRFGIWLRPTAVVDSGGYIPVSIAVNGDLLYVLNAGGSGAVVTFGVDVHGSLVKLDTLDLGLANSTTIPFDNVMAPGQVGVDALHRQLIVANGGGQELLVATLDDDGLPGGDLVSTPTPGVVPFAFDVTEFGNVLVAEAGSASVSSFDPPTTGAGPLALAVGAVANGQGATCWIVVQRDGYAYVSNTATNNLSSYRYTRTSGLTLLDAEAAVTGANPTDMTLAGDGRYLYSLDAGTGDISGFAIDPDDGSLRKVDTQSGLPAAAGIQGIAARDGF